MSEQKCIILYHDALEQWDMLSDEQAGILIKALLRYGQSGERIKSNDEALIMAFSFISSQIDRDHKKWETACEKRSKYMKERWERSKSTIVDYSRPIVTVTDTVTDTGTVTVTDTVTSNNTLKSIINKNNIESVGGPNPPTAPTKKFKKPTLEEVQAYCKERKSSISAEYFYDYYESNGWKVGKNPMKDWKATVRRWELREQSNSKNSQQPELKEGADGFLYDKNGERYV